MFEDLINQILELVQQAWNWILGFVDGNVLAGVIVVLVIILLIKKILD